MSQARSLYKNASQNLIIDLTNCDDEAAPDPSPRVVQTDELIHGWGARKHRDDPRTEQTLNGWAARKVPAERASSSHAENRIVNLQNRVVHQAVQDTQRQAGIGRAAAQSPTFPISPAQISVPYNNLNTAGDSIRRSGPVDHSNPFYGSSSFEQIRFPPDHRQGRSNQHNAQPGLYHDGHRLQSYPQGFTSLQIRQDAKQNARQQDYQRHSSSSQSNHVGPPSSTTQPQRYFSLNTWPAGTPFVATSAIPTSDTEAASRAVRAEQAKDGTSNSKSSTSRPVDCPIPNSSLKRKRSTNGQDNHQTLAIEPSTVDSSKKSDEDDKLKGKESADHTSASVAPRQSSNGDSKGNAVSTPSGIPSRPPSSTPTTAPATSMARPAPSPPPETSCLAPTTSSATSPVNESDNFLPSYWDSTLPRDIISLLNAMRMYTLPNLRPNRNRVMKWAVKHLPDVKHFNGYGDLSASSPLWNYSLKELGLTEEAWRYLNKKGGDGPSLPGSDQPRKRSGRPSLTRPDVGNAPREPVIQPAISSDRNSGERPVDAPDRNVLASVAPVKPFEQTGNSEGTSRVHSVSTPSGPVLPATSAGHDASATTDPQETAGTSLHEDAHLQSLLEALHKKIAGRDFRGEPWEPEEDNLLIYLKEVKDQRWPIIATFMRHRMSRWEGCQVHYSTRLRHRNKPTVSKHQPPAPKHQQAKSNLTASDLRESAQTATAAVDDAPASRNARKSSRLERSDATSRNYVLKDQFSKLLGPSLEEPNIDVEGEETADIQQPRIIRRSVHGGPLAQQAGVASVPKDVRASAAVRTTAAPLRRAQDIAESDRDHAAVAGELLKVTRPRIRRDIPGFPNAQKRSQLIKRHSISIDRPYLSPSERRYLKKSNELDIWDKDNVAPWHGSNLHVDFSDAELEELEGHAVDLCEYDIPLSQFASLPPRERLRRILSLGFKNAPHAKDPVTTQIGKISAWVLNSGGLLNRTARSIENFLTDVVQDQAQDGSSRPSSVLTRLEVLANQKSVLRALRRREIASVPIKRSQALNREAVYDSLGPLLSFTGTSSDVNTVAWSPDGSTFAAGSAALTDSHSMQYNRSNNLLLGELQSKSLKELPNHATARKLTSEGANSTREMHISQDPMLYQSVCAIGFTADGTAMISGGYDNTLRIFDVREGIEEAYMKYAYTHKAPIDVLAVSNGNLFATGANRSARGVRVFKHDLDADDAKYLSVQSFSSPRAEANPDQCIAPSSLKWDESTYSQSRYLLCGFSSQLKDFGEGEVCAWDVEAGASLMKAWGSKNIFDVAWSPTHPGRFAVARSCAPQTVNQGTQSVVHIFDASADSTANRRQMNGQRTMELECPALDINDVVFNPSDDFMVSVGCTDGCTYVWDLRRPGQLLHRFAHGKPVMELYGDRPREELDTGIRFLSWDATQRGLVSGSSDGIVASWNPYAAPEDAYVKTIAQLKSGVMSGAFNQDFSNLLLGEVNGSLNVLQVGRDDDDDIFEDFKLQRASEDEMDQVYQQIRVERPTPEDDSGKAASKRLLESGSMVLRPFGDLPIRQAVQGPSYAYYGLYDPKPNAEILRQEALERQENFRPSADPCKVDHDIPRLTEEEKGDNSAWTKRIPESFHSLPLAQRKKHLAENFECSRCNGPLLARCYGGFEGLLDRPVYDADVLRCEDCELLWRIDLLGFTPLNETRFAYNWPRPGKPTTCARRQRSCSVVDDDDDDDDDDDSNSAQESTKDLEDAEKNRDQLQALDEYVHSFWQDRPPSPL